MRNKKGKLGHQAPKGSRINVFNRIDIDGEFAYCKSHNFIYNTRIENYLLHQGKPCYYTDDRYYDGRFNFYKECSIHWTRFKDITLKACIRKTSKCRNIPVGTIVRFSKSWSFRGNKSDLSFTMKIKKENTFDPQYEINSPYFLTNFNTCEFSKKLVDELRNNGFLVKVYNKNPNFISGMIETAAEAIGNPLTEEEKIVEEGEYAIAWGYGKQIGFSSKDNTYRGYSCGCKNILWDFFDEFDKWSRCREIKKTAPISKIVEILMTEKPEEDSGEFLTSSEIIEMTETEEDTGEEKDTGEERSFIQRHE